MPLALSKPTLTEGASPSCEAGSKLGVVEMALVWQVLHEDPQCPSRVVLAKVAQSHVAMAVSVRHLNRLRAQGTLHRRTGRPGQTALSRLVGAGAALVQVRPHLSCVGGPLLAHGLDQQEGFAPVLARLQQAIEAEKPPHPDDDLALVPQRQQTLWRRLQALCWAPRLGLETWTGFAPHAPPLQTLRGRGSHRSTLRQVLGPRERMDAAEVLRPALVPDTAGHIPSVDGHRLAYGSRLSMHKGTSTLLGRIMAGSQAVMAPHEAGQALLVADSPPDLPLAQVMVASGPQVAVATGSPLLVIDRAVKAVARACAFDPQGLGLLGRLDDTEPAGLDSCTATEVGTRADGTKVSRGEGKVPRPEDPRHWVLVEPAAGKTLVDGGTPQVKATVETTAWPRGDRERHERQEHGFKRLMDQGALTTNDGRKMLVGPDRHQQRVREQLEPSREAAQKRGDKKTEALQAPQAQVAESPSQGPGTRLEQRQRTFVEWAKECKDAQHTHAQLTEQAAAIGPPRERADRDVRTQTSLTVRTLRLENALRACMGVLGGHLQTKVSLDCIVSMLCERSGTRMETNSQVV